ncbi:MAG: 3-hydroxyacyl-CoA dehydrogenase/enoyl-CoA hydratase family protein [Gammaproteobacteria bacterium]
MNNIISQLSLSAQAFSWFSSKRETHWNIGSVAVLGAGVMGAKIAAVFVNAGYSVILFDLPAGEASKNMLAEDAIDGLLKTRPPALVDPEWARFITPANYETDLPKLKECGLIIEAIAERMDWKRDLFAKIAPFIAPDAVLATNTSGLSIEKLADVLPKELRPRFLGLHFFNPPRYLPLLEMIPSIHTNPALLDELEAFFTTYLGKNVLRAFDTPNFIGNRLGVFSLLSTLHHAEAFDLRFDVADALTGTMIGRPKSATFRTIDVVGLDTFAHVVETMARDLKDDPWHELFVVPAWLKKMIEKGALGEKTGAGIYKKEKGELFVFDAKDGEYKKVTAQPNHGVSDILKDRNKAHAFKKIFDHKHPEAQFVWSIHRDLWQYAAYHLKDIAHNVRDVDSAMKWGFAWQQGPFELWQAIGVESVATKITQDPASMQLSSVLPEWMSSLDAHQFYQGNLAFSAQTLRYESPSTLPVYERQSFIRLQHSNLDESDIVYQDDFVELWHYTGSVFVLSFKSKMASISRGVLAGIVEAIKIAQEKACALVIWQRKGDNFSVGADIREFLEAIRAKNFAQIDDTLKNFQDACLMLRYARIPVVAALQGYVLGGGCELALHCDARVAHQETYMGLVEAGVGLLPGGGGCKELALRASDADPANPMRALKKSFENIAMAKASENAFHAKKMGYLTSSDTIIQNPNELLFVAAKLAQAMAASGYCPPRAPRISVAGEAGWAQLETQLVNMVEGKFITPHDYVVAHHIAKVMCGGMIDALNEVDEQWMLRIEREGFVDLAQTPETQARIEHMLETGKPLRN